MGISVSIYNPKLHPLFARKSQKPAKKCLGRTDRGMRGAVTKHFLVGRSVCMIDYLIQPIKRRGFQSCHSYSYHLLVSSSLFPVSHQSANPQSYLASV